MLISLFAVPYSHYKAFNLCAAVHSLRISFSQVPNYLPSISAATDFVPEKYIWRIAIGLVSLQSFRSASMYYQYYQRNPAVVKESWFARWNKANYVMHVMENVGLLLGVNVSHVEDGSEFDRQGRGVYMSQCFLALFSL